MKDNSDRLRRRLRKVGLSESAIEAAWPAWWSDAADASASAQTELRFSLARKLGLDPHSLLDDEEEPRFIWTDEARFKHLSGEGPQELAAITSFGTALGRYLIAATTGSTLGTDWSSTGLRIAILRNQPYVRLLDLLAVCWSLGIPTIHLRIFPSERKRMSAMAVRIGERNAIMLGKDSMYPPHVAFYLAHELAHIGLGHLSREPVVVDLDDVELAVPDGDPEEVAADRFALELLTGLPEPKVLPWSAYNAPELARVAIEASSRLAIEPGTLALCFGYSTQDWATANAALQRIYAKPQPVWAEVNKLALSQLALDLIPDDARAYLKTVLGEVGAA
ncbi:MAG TPA: hypothetical protein VG204_02580 [Terriglobia bacterium]|nr:hypothetical protein [Terriglobia bacterium]